MARIPIATPTEYIRKPPKEGHLFTQDTLDGTNGVRIIDVSLYPFWLWETVLQWYVFPPNTFP